ncbi:MAG TPA: LLM class flavin-dependent oxidoreductase [Solirubrobacterales bacterium]|nr:LLM class flavin-dependent oxidoreductase [Solirubrobacterales bacterium]
MTEIGIFVVPSAEHPELTIRQALVAEEAGLELIGVQDHPYQRRYLDTWTLLAYLAGRTQRLRLATDVVNLPLRLPAVLAKAAASLDVLSGGRFELGIGAGSFWDAVEAMGGPRRTPGESVTALAEAIAILRAFWSGDRSVRVEGEHYRVNGAKPGPQPAHPIGIWVGAYGPRMLALTGRLADGWLPSVGSHYADPRDVPAMQTRIDDAAKRAGRDPAAVRRVANAMGLSGEAGSWAGQLERVAELGFDTILVAVREDDPLGFIRRLGEDVAPALR